MWSKKEKKRDAGEGNLLVALVCTLLSGGGRVDPFFICWSADVLSCLECVLLSFMQQAPLRWCFIWIALFCLFCLAILFFCSLVFLSSPLPPPPPPFNFFNFIFYLLINKAVDLWFFFFFYGWVGACTPVHMCLCMCLHVCSHRPNIYLILSPDGPDSTVMYSFFTPWQTRPVVTDKTLNFFCSSRIRQERGGEKEPGGDRQGDERLRQRSGIETARRVPGTCSHVGQRGGPGQGLE